PALHRLFLPSRPPPRPPLFPYTTLFRSAVEVPAHEDPQAGTGAPPGLLGDLQRHAVGRHDVIAADHAFVLHAEDLLEIHAPEGQDRKSTRLNSSHVSISYAVFCLKKKKT